MQTTPLDYSLIFLGWDGGGVFVVWRAADVASARPLDAAEVLGVAQGAMLSLSAKHRGSADTNMVACMQCTGDRQKLLQFMLKLVPNAVKFAPQGLSVTLTVTAIYPGPHAGVDLGGTIAKTIAQQYRARLAVDAVKGEAATYWLTIPIVRSWAPPHLTPDPRQAVA